MALKHLKKMESLLESYKKEVNETLEETRDILGDKATLSNELINLIETFNGFFKATEIALSSPIKMRELSDSSFDNYVSFAEEYLACMQDKEEEKIIEQARLDMLNFKSTYYILETVTYYTNMPKRSSKLSWYNKEYSKLFEEVWNSTYLLCPFEEYIKTLIELIRKEYKNLKSKQ